MPILSESDRKYFEKIDNLKYLRYFLALGVLSTKVPFDSGPEREKAKQSMKD